MGKQAGLGAHAAAQQDGDVVRIEPSVLRLAAMDRRQREGVAEDEGKACWRPQVGAPGPR
jgi:hypothetical protein